jgi:uncharacterized membrane protein YeaQ/YmgE (transglycosylase-associated protein family)
VIGDLIGFIVWGLIIGFLARLVIPGRQRIGLLRTLLIGILGSVIGGMVVSLIDAGDVFELNFLGVIVAAAVAAVLLVAGERAGLLESGERERLDRRH